MKLKILEKDIQKSCLDYLQIKKYFHWRQNVGSILIQDRYIKFGGIKGIGDLFILINSKIISCEIKTEKGKQSPDQIEFEKNFTAQGGIYWIIRSLDDLIDKLKSNSF